MIANGFLIWDAQSGPVEVVLAVVLICVAVVLAAGAITRWIWGDWPF